MDSHKVSYVILNRDRRDRVCETVRSALEQDYPDKEVIVVDNGSTDDSVEVLRERFPQCKIMELGENKGIAGRNEGIRAAGGDYVFCLDNDITFLDKDGTQRAVERMQQDPRVACLSMMIAEEPLLDEFTSNHWWHLRPRDLWQYHEFPSSHFNEAAVMFRASALKETGLFMEELFWACEEIDMALRIMDCGYEILYFPGTRVLHQEPRGIMNTQANTRHFLITRNRFWIILKNYPLPYATQYIGLRTVLWSLRGIRYGYLGLHLKGFFAFLRMAPKILQDRTLISKETRKRLFQIEKSSDRLRPPANE